MRHVSYPFPLLLNVVFAMVMYFPWKDARASNEGKVAPAMTPDFFWRVIRGNGNAEEKAGRGKHGGPS